MKDLFVPLRKQLNEMTEYERECSLFADKRNAIYERVFERMVLV